MAVLSIPSRSAATFKGGQNLPLSALSLYGQPRVRRYFLGESAENTVIDYSAAVRPLIDLQGTVLGIANQVDGITTGGTLFEGFGSVADAWESRKAALRIGNHSKARDEVVNAVGMSALGAGGAAYLVYRGAAIGAQMRGETIAPDSSSAMGRAAWGSASAGNVLFGMFYGVLAKNALQALAKTAHFHYKLDEEFLREQLAPIDVSSVDFKKKAIEEGALLIDGALEEMRKEGVWADAPVLKKGQSAMLYEKIVGSSDALERIGRAAADTHARMIQDQKLVEIVGKKKLKVLRDDTIPIDQKVALVKEKFNIGRYFKFFRKTILYLAGVVWAITAFISDPLTNIIYGVQSLICVLWDLKAFKKWWKSGDVGEWDKIITVSLMVLLAVSVVASIVFAPYIAIPFWMFIASISIKAVWMGVLCLKLYRMEQKVMEKPTVEALYKFLETHPSEEEAQEVFGKLPQGERAEVFRAFNAYRRELGMTFRKEDEGLSMSELKIALEELIERRKREKVQALKMLRREMENHLPSCYAPI